MAVITSGDATITPSIVLGVTTARSAGNIVHPILGRTNPDVTLRPAGLRTGVISLGFTGPTSEADSQTAADSLATGGVFILSDTDRETVAMSFVLQEMGGIRRTLDPDTRDDWTVDVDYQEVVTE